MKIFFAFIIIACCINMATAQVKPNLYKNELRYFNNNIFKADTSVNNLIPGGTSQKSGSYFNTPGNSIFNNANAQIVYSRMPVAHLQSADRMGVVRLSANGQAMPVKKVVIADPFKPALPLQ